MRVLGTTGQESSLEAQEAKLRATATGTVGFRDRVRPARGPARPGEDAGGGRRREVTAVWVTHEDRQARFGAGWLWRLLAAHGATVEVLRAKAQGGREELLEDFVSLLTTFAGACTG